MLILVVGGGGREHALVWKIAKSPLVKEIVASPGNPGIAKLARCIPISPADVEGQVALARREKPDLIVVGPEAPLVSGLADRLRAEGLTVFGPSQAAARLEGSKIFAKEFMVRAGIPTASFSTHDDISSALSEVSRRNGPCVVKADGLAAGKGVMVCMDKHVAERAVKDIMQDRQFGDAGNRILIEDLIQGEEASVLAICDGKRFVPLVAAQDHKAAYEGDTGPNTGGMGAYTPAPLVSGSMMGKIISQVIRPTVDKMDEEGAPFIGVLYAGLMIENGLPKVLEFNVRFGDPECQPLMALMKGDLVPVLDAAAKGHLDGFSIEWHDGAALCVVLAAGGYPGLYETDKPIFGLDTLSADPMVTVFHAGTKMKGDTIVTAGGRVLGVTARGASLKQAADAAYKITDCISWQGMRMRRDIGHRAL